MLAPTPAGDRDVVELLLDAHVDFRHTLSLAEGLTHGSATRSAAEAAQGVADFIEWLLPLHFEDEEASLATRLLGRHRVVDDALEQMKRQHLCLEAPFARLRLVCRLLARDISRLHALRFELAAAVTDARAQLEGHHALEESIVFPALKRMLYADELDGIRAEMLQRRALLAA